MKRTFSLFLILLFLTAGIAGEGPACASLAEGQPACCQNCPLKMMPKIGDSCCHQGIEKGSFGLVLLLQQSVKKRVPGIATTLIKNEWVAFHLSSVSSSLPKENSIYLTEEHLLL